MTDSLPAGTSAAPPTLRAIFLPATWGIITKEVLAADFEQRTGIKVEIDLIRRDAIHDLAGTLFAARDASYDLINLDYNWVLEFAQAGHLAPLDHIVGDDGFLPKALEVARCDGTLFAVPQTVHPHLLWYRKDLFDEAGLAPPATMEAWLTATRFFQGKEIGGRTLYGWAGQAVRSYGNVHTWLTFLYSFGGDAFADFTTLEPTLDRPEAREATEFWAEMMRYTPPDIHDYSYNEVIAAAASGTVATCLHGSWGAFVVDDPATSQTVGKWDFVTVPRARASVPHLAEWVTTISTYSRQHEAASAFLRYLASPENDVRQALLGGGDPVRMTSYTDPLLTEARVAGHPELRRFRRHERVLEAMQTARPRPLFAHEEQWESVVSASLFAIAHGRCSAHAGLTKAQRDVLQLMKDLGYRR